MKAEHVPISRLKANPANPRSIKAPKFRKLVQSIQDFPEMLEARPLVASKDGTVLGGNMRLKACREAGLKTVPVLFVEWTDHQAAQFIIKDNVGYGEWDWDALANEWDPMELEAWGLDIWNPKEDAEPVTEVCELCGK